MLSIKTLTLYPSVLLLSLGHEVLPFINVVNIALVLIAIYFFLDLESLFFRKIKILEVLILVCLAYFVVIGIFTLPYSIGSPTYPIYFCAYFFLAWILFCRRNLALNFMPWVKVGLWFNIMIGIVQSLMMVGVFPVSDIFVRHVIWDDFVLVSGFHGNPNNYITILNGLLIMCLLDRKTDLESSKLTDNVYFLAVFLVGMLCVAVGSRLNLFFLFFLAFQFRKSIGIRSVSAIIAWCIISFFLVFFLNQKYNLLTVTKLLSTLNGIDGQSIGFRLESYIQAIGNGIGLPLGRGPANYCDIYSGMPEFESFLCAAPHSFVLEMIMAFGMVGALFLMLLLAYHFSIIRRLKYTGFVVLSFYMWMVSMSPSTLFLTPIFFFIIFSIRSLPKKSNESFYTV